MQLKAPAVSTIIQLSGYGPVVTEQLAAPPALMNAIDDREAQKTNFGRRRASRKWRRGVVDGLAEEEKSRAVQWYNSRSDIRLRSLAIRSRLKPEVTRLPGEACVSAIFGITFLMVLFPSDLDGVVGFWIGGLVR